MKDKIKKLEEFQIAFRSTINFEPTQLTDEQIDLRIRLFEEEYEEYLEAREKGNRVEMMDGLCDMMYILLGSVVSCGMQDFKLDKYRFASFFVNEHCDMFYNLEDSDNEISYAYNSINIFRMLDGFSEECFDECFNEVHRSNMSKLNADGTFTKREDGKILKPETYSKPNLKPIIERYETNSNF